MLRTVSYIIAAGLAAGLASCGQPVTDTADSEGAPDAAETAVPEAGASGETAMADASATANILELEAVGMTFNGPGEIESGWITIRFSNMSDMVHFAIIERLPEGITIDDQLDQLVPVFQGGMDALAEGDTDAADAIFATIPEWMSDIQFIGGPGFVSGGGTTSATVFLEPGRYTIECYVKSNGTFHSTVGMLHELIVTDSGSAATPPDANMTLAVSADGYDIVDGSLMPGHNTIRVEYREQAVYGNFVGHDVHIVQLDADADTAAISNWMDWRRPDGLDTATTPARFVGGLNEMPAGTGGYFTAELAPGEYALIAEIPDPVEAGFYLPITVAAEEAMPEAAGGG